MEDGCYRFVEIKDLFNKSKDFKTEKELCDLFEDNIEMFCESLGIDYDSHERESYMTKWKGFGANSPRIDFLIKQKDKSVVLIEAKNPRNQHREVNMSISQLLDYIVIAEDMNLNIDKAYTLTSKCDDSFLRIIKRFMLPISVILINRTVHAILQEGES